MTHPRYNKLLVSFFILDPRIYSDYFIIITFLFRNKEVLQKVEPVIIYTLPIPTTYPCRAWEAGAYLKQSFSKRLGTPWTGRKFSTGHKQRGTHTLPNSHVFGVLDEGTHTCTGRNTM